MEKIEGVLGQSPLVSQIWVHGDRFESCLVAVVVPSRSKLEVSRLNTMRWRVGMFADWFPWVVSATFGPACWWQPPSFQILASI